MREDLADTDEAQGFSGFFSDSRGEFAVVHDIKKQTDKLSFCDVGVCGAFGVRAAIRVFPIFEWQRGTFSNEAYRNASCSYQEGALVCQERNWNLKGMFTVYPNKVLVGSSPLSDNAGSIFVE